MNEKEAGKGEVFFLFFIIIFHICHNHFKIQAHLNVCRRSSNLFHIPNYIIQLYTTTATI